jgi:hypothetical protein
MIPNGVLEIDETAGRGKGGRQASAAIVVTFLRCADVNGSELIWGSELVAALGSRPIQPESGFPPVQVDQSSLESETTLPMMGFAGLSEVTGSLTGVGDVVVTGSPVGVGDAILD